MAIENRKTAPDGTQTVSVTGIPVSPPFFLDLKRNVSQVFLKTVGATAIEVCLEASVDANSNWDTVPGSGGSLTIEQTHGPGFWIRSVSGTADVLAVITDLRGRGGLV